MKNKNQLRQALIGFTMPISLPRFRNLLGVSTSTAYRWRKQGLLKVDTLNGRHYVRTTEAVRFLEQLESGSLTGTVCNPSRVNSKASI